MHHCVKLIGGGRTFSSPPRSLAIKRKKINKVSFNIYLKIYFKNSLKDDSLHVFGLSFLAKERIRRLPFAGGKLSVCMSTHPTSTTTYCTHSYPVNNCNWLVNFQTSQQKEINDIKLLLRVLKMYIPLPVFWALFHQQVNLFNLSPLFWKFLPTKEGYNVLDHCSTGEASLPKANNIC